MNRRVQNKNSKSVSSVWVYIFHVLLLLVVVGCSNEFENPEKVIRSYYRTVYSVDKNFKKAYKYISSESKKHMTFADFVDSFSNMKNDRRRIFEIAIENDYLPNYVYLKVTFDRIADSSTNENERTYHTLVHEEDGWKIVMTNPLDKIFEEKENIFDDEVIEIGKNILEIDPYNFKVSNSLTSLYYNAENKEKMIENLRRSLTLSAKISPDILATFKKCSSDDECLYSEYDFLYKSKQIDQFLYKQEFDQAKALLQSVKSSLTDDKYNSLVKKISDYEFPPMYITINQLTADLGKLEFTEAWDFWMRKKIKRVKVPAYFSSSVDRMRRELTAYSSGCAEGSSMSVFYEKTNMEAFFTSEDPKCSNKYIVTGELKFFSNTGSPYIQAESIE